MEWTTLFAHIAGPRLLIGTASVHNENSKQECMNLPNLLNTSTICLEQAFLSWSLRANQRHHPPVNSISKDQSEKHVICG